MAVEKGDYNDIPLGLFSERTLHRGWNHIWWSALCCYSQNAHQMAARINFLTSVLFSRCAIDEGRRWLFTVTYTRLYCRNSTRRQQRVPFFITYDPVLFFKIPTRWQQRKTFHNDTPWVFFSKWKWKSSTNNFTSSPVMLFPHFPPDGDTESIFTMIYTWRPIFGYYSQNAHDMKAEDDK